MKIKNRTIQTYLLFLILLFTQPSYGEDTNLSGLWAKNCNEFILNFRGRYFVKPSIFGYNFRDCNDPHCGFERSLYYNPLINPLPSFVMHSYRNADNHKIKIDGNLVEKCADYDSDTNRRYSSEKEIRKGIIGGWRGSNVRSSGHGGSIGDGWFFHEDGNVSIEYPSDTYDVKGDQIIIKGRKQRVLKVLYLSDKYAILEKIKGFWDLGISIYERTDVLIDDKWLEGRFFSSVLVDFKSLSPDDPFFEEGGGFNYNDILNYGNKWEKASSFWLNLKPINDYEASRCSFSYFAKDHTYTSVTSVCYRLKKNPRIIHIDESSKYVYNLSYGKWHIKDNVIYTDALPVGGHKEVYHKFFGSNWKLNRKESKFARKHHDYTYKNRDQHLPSPYRNWYHVPGLLIMMMKKNPNSIPPMKVERVPEFMSIYREAVKYNEAINKSLLTK